MANIDLWLNTWLVLESNIKKIYDYTDPNNIYIWITQDKNSIEDTNKPIWNISKIEINWDITKTWLKVEWSEDKFNLIWDNRQTYTYK